MTQPDHRPAWDVDAGTLTASRFKRLYAEHQLLRIRGSGAAGSGSAWLHDPIAPCL